MTDPATYIEGRTVQEQMNSLIGYVDERSAEVALDAIAADVAQVAADKADAHADALAAAASAAAAAGTLANAVTLTDAQTITGAKTFSVSPVVPTPTNNTDASTKKYVDDADASILAAINSLDAAVVKLTGNQTVGGTKTFSASPVGPTEATGTFSTKLATSDKVKNELDAYAPMVRTTGNQTIAGDKKFVGKLFERCAYVKNTTGATTPVPLFKISTTTKNDGYMNCVMMITGRTVPVTVTQLLWNSGTLTKTDIVGSQTNTFSIMSDDSGNYWVCATIAANNTINAFVFQCMRNAGFIDPVEPLMQGETPDMSGWATVVSQT